MLHPIPEYGIVEHMYDIRKKHLGHQSQNVVDGVSVNETRKAVMPVFAESTGHLKLT